MNIRKMTLADLPFAMRLKAEAGFNQTEADWRRFVELQPNGCFVAELDGEPSGTVATFVFESIGWIAMLLVARPVRGRGIGTQLVKHALDYLETRGVTTVRLDATPLGRPIYERLGFVAEYELLRMEGVSPGSESRPAEPISAEQLGAVLELDQEITGTNRRRLIERLFKEAPNAMCGIEDAGKLSGYVTFREGTQAAQLGPGIALNAEVGQSLGNTAMQRLKGRPVFVDIPADNHAAVDWAQAKHLLVQRPFTRMRRGEPIDDNPRCLWASSGPEKG